MFKKLLSFLFFLYVLVPWSLLYGYFFAKIINIDYFWVVVSSAMWYIGYGLFWLYKKYKGKLHASKNV
jgi:hypothetical protein